jgi:hypothetical protein
MADATNSGVHRYEGAGVKWSGGSPRSVRLIQWVQDAGDINHTNADLVIVVNGTALTFKFNPHDTAATQDDGNVVIYQAGPFNPGYMVNNFEITTIDAGHVHVWVD